MLRPQAALILVLALPLAAAEFSGASAMNFARQVVSFGPRPPNSAALEKLRAYVLKNLRASGCQVSEDAFTASTPLGPMPMKNLICRFPGQSGQAVVFSGHYDTKLMPGTYFIGANDGGSSTALLLELARCLANRPRKHDVYLVFFDGEEAIGQWSETDGLHGSRNLARRWARDGTLERIRALVNVDMIGDKHLGIVQEMHSSSSLRRTIWQVAAELGYARFFLDQGGYIEDDHTPFLRLGANAADLIDFDYGPGNSWWHTSEDTIDKLSPESFEVVGRVLLELLHRLEQ